MNTLKILLISVITINVALATEWNQPVVQAELGAGFGKIQSPENFRSNWLFSTALNYKIPVFVEGHTRASIEASALWSWSEAEEIADSYGSNYAQVSTNIWYEHDIISSGQTYWFGLGLGGFVAFLPNRYSVFAQNEVISSAWQSIDPQLGVHLNARLQIPLDKQFSVSLRGQYGLTDYSIHGVTTALTYQF